jgi:hypothetical protein
MLPCDDWLGGTTRDASQQEAAIVRLAKDAAMQQGRSPLPLDAPHLPQQHWEPLETRAREKGLT